MADEVGGLPGPEQYAAVAIEQSLSALSALADLQPRASLSLLIEVLEAELEAAVPRLGRFGEGVFVGPLSSAVGLDLDLICVVGLAEDLYPGRLSPDPLLTERMRAESGGAWPTLADGVERMHRHLLAAFASAEAVITSFPRGDLRRNTARRPTRWLLPTLQALSGRPTVRAATWDQVQAEGISGSRSFWHELHSTMNPAHEQEWRLRALATGVVPNDPVVAAATELIGERSSRRFTRFDGNLHHVTGLPDYAHEPRTVSPTRLEQYAQCPHTFFVKYLLRVHPLEQPEDIITIRPLDRGTLMHACMDRLIKRARDEGTLPDFGRPWTSAHRAQLESITHLAAADVEAEGLTGHPLLWERGRLVIAADLRAMLDDDDAFRARRGRTGSGERADFRAGRDRTGDDRAAGRAGPHGRQR